jgi:hypothetical protein
MSVMPAAPCDLAHFTSEYARARTREYDALTTALGELAGVYMLLQASGIDPEPEADALLTKITRRKWAIYGACEDVELEMLHERLKEVD